MTGLLDSTDRDQAARAAAERLGLLLGLLGVLAFAVTLPATRLAVAEMPVWTVGFGRGALAGLAAGALLLILRVPWPGRKDLPALAVTALGVVFGFPLLSTWAMQSVPAAHGGVVIGILPLATALAAALVAGERPSAGFWATALLGSAAVVTFALLDTADGAAGSAAGLTGGDLALLAAVVAAGLGYAYGARLSRHLPGWTVICWALVLSLPVMLPAAAVSWIAAPPSGASAGAWAGFLYVALVSQLAGFFVWYRGLALGGVARVGQVQLLQPFLTLLIAALLLAEPITITTLAFSVLVVGLVVIGRRQPIRRSPD
ncbi:DMT family transporter [Algihabitans albus]|uniref:DMT family transporter n=1 Tax=Algihabitans albus TaxID=2164067 RepID=UPI000E5C748F|nr:DMT family transporter [Algihabitans albus]